MAALGLGDVEDFPLPRPARPPPGPRRRRRCCTSSGALDPTRAAERLTPLGRRLARLPVDPRLGADGPRGRPRSAAPTRSSSSPRRCRSRTRASGPPTQQRAGRPAARALRATSARTSSRYLNLWRYLREQQRELSGNQFRKRCKAEFLHYLRVREWQDLVGQLRQAASEVGVTRNQKPADPDQVHRALLAGLLSHIGLRDAATARVPGRARRPLRVVPGSALARRPPAWVMAAELVETIAAVGPEAARIQPAWIEPLARAPGQARSRRAALGPPPRRGVRPSA